MSVSTEQLNRILSEARALEAQGYFWRVKAGDQKAASLFARLVAFNVNPSGFVNDVGWLSKSPGESQVEGYAEDAICGNADPSDLANVIDLVNGAGAANASIGGAVKERRTNNQWVKPLSLTTAELNYLLVGAPVPPPPATKVIPKGEAFTLLSALNAFYASPDGLQRPGGMVRPDSEGRSVADMEAIAQWFYQLVIEGVSFDDVKAQIRNSQEWKDKHR